MVICLIDTKPPRMKQKYFLAKWLNNQLSPEELAEFKKHPDYEIYENIRKYSQNIPLKDFNEDEMLQRILESKKQYKRKTISLQWVYKIAAVILFFAGIIYFTVAKISTKTYITNPYTAQTFSLPDHSKVVLNPNSELSYHPFNWEQNRKISLKGSAYFHVSKGRKFEVATELGKVSVLGTQFVVSSINKKFHVRCYEGKVKVSYKQKEAILTKGMAVKFENDKQYNTFSQEINPYEKPTFLVFKNEKLDVILSHLMEVYHIKIISNTTSNEFFTGKIPTDNLDIALSIISSTYHLTFQKNDENTFYLRPNK